MTVLSYERRNAPFAIPTAPATPANCESAPYTAGAGEVAIISGNVTLFNAATTGTAYFAPVYTIGGGGTIYPVSFYAIETAQQSTSATLHHQAVVTLVEGSVYRFRTEVRAPNGAFTVGEIVCRGLVTIAKH